MEAGLLTKLADQLISSGPYGVVLLMVAFGVWRLAKWLAPRAESFTSRHFEFIDSTSKAIQKLTENQSIQVSTMQQTAETNERMENLVSRINDVDEQKFILLRDIAKTQGQHTEKLDEHGRKLDAHGQVIQEIRARLPQV